MLLHDFAIEPEILTTWDAFRMYDHLFGISKGRLIARFPRKWEKKVVKAVYSGPAGDVEKLKIIERLNMISKSKIIYREYAWDNLPTWIENAIQEQKRNPFHAIISLSNPDGDSSIVLSEDVTEDHPVIKVESRIKINKTAEEMSLCADKLLRLSNEIVFVDRYFKPADRWYPPLKAFLRIIADRLNINAIRRLELHMGIDIESGEKPDVFLGNCKKALEKIVPRGLTLSLMLWDWSQIKNRYILTEKAGILYANGLDEQPDKRDNVHIMDNSEWLEEWEKHKEKIQNDEVHGVWFCPEKF